jgi:hypothetical protein
VVRVTGGSNRRVSLAALICVKPGCRPRLLYRVHTRRPKRKDNRKGFTETDYARLLDAAHQQLGGPIVVVWDNLNAHVSATMAELIAARDWLTVYRLPLYAHELNPVPRPSPPASPLIPPDCLRQAGSAGHTSGREDPLACLRCAGWPLARAGHADGGRFPATRANSLSRVA